VRSILFFAFARSFLKKNKIFVFFNLCPEGALYEGSRGEDLLCRRGQGNKKQKIATSKRRSRGGRSLVLIIIFININQNCLEEAEPEARVKKQKCFLCKQRGSRGARGGSTRSTARDNKNKNKNEGRAME
jgi:hypothetical protein